MKRKPKISEIVLLGVLGLTVLWVLSLDSKVKRARAKNQAARSAAIENPVQLAVQAADNRSRAGIRISAGDVSPYWGLDPFDRSFTRDEAAGSAGDVVEAGGGARRLHLFGVIISEGAATALIDHNVCTEGDTLGDYLVRSISKERVILENMFDFSQKTLRVE